jgi:hypothetical protein
VDSLTSTGGVFYLKECTLVKFSNTEFNGCGGSGSGGAISLDKCNSTRFSDVIFKEIRVFPSVSSKGGAVYAVLDDDSFEIKFDGGEFTKCSASKGRGGAIFYQFSDEIDDNECDEYKKEGYDDPRKNRYYFNETKFNDNIAVKGSNIFIAARGLDKLIVIDNFKLNLTVSGEGLKTLYGLEECNKSLSSLVGVLLDLSNSEVVYVSSNECPEDLNRCEIFKDAFSSGSNDLRIGIVENVDLNEAITIYGNVVFITPADLNGVYAVLVVGVSGTIYIQSDGLSSRSRQKKNEGQGGNIIFAQINIKLSYRVGLMPNPFTVIHNGSATFSDCVFNSAGDDEDYPDYISVYIGDVLNNGKLIFERCEMHNMEIKNNVLIHGYDSSEVVIEVCNNIFFYVGFF